MAINIDDSKTNFNKISFTVIIVIFAFIISYCYYLLFRNNRVLCFRTDLLFQVLHTEENKEFFRIMNERNSYDIMLFSFKPLKVDCWFTEEEINKYELTDRKK